MDRATTTRKVEMKVRKFDETMNSIDRSVVFLTFSRGICDMQFFTRDSRDLYDIHWQAHMFETTLRFFTEEQKKKKKNIPSKSECTQYRCISV